MKQNLNEELSRIKQMMGINEERVNLNDYNDESSIIEDIKHVGTSEDGNPMTSMKINTFVSTPGTESEGEKVKIEVILEWKPELYGKKKYVIGFNLKSVVDVKSDVELDKSFLQTIRIVFTGKLNGSPKNLVSRIYGPYLTKMSKNTDDIDKIYNNMKKDENALENVLFGNASQPSEPKIQDTPKIEPEVNNEPPQEKPSNGNNMWTSTSSW